MKNLAFILVISLLAAVSTSGQSPRRSVDTTGISSFATVGLRYRSDYYYMGRSDSVKVPYLIPSIAYYHKSGFFISSTLSYLTLEGSTRVDLFTLSGGYEYFGRKFATGVSVDQYFFNAESNSVQAEMSTYLSGYIGYDLSALMVIADASVGVSERFDFFLGGEISRTFYLLRGHLLITPSFYTNLGTQRYYNEYYTQRTLTTGGMGPGSGAGPDHGSGAGDGSGSGSGDGSGSGSGDGSGSGSGDGSGSGSGDGSGSGSGDGSGSGSGDGSGSGSGDGSGAGDGSGSGSGAGQGSRTAGKAEAPADITTITDISILESDKFQVLDYELGLQMSYKVSRFRFSIAGTFLFPVNPSKVVTNLGTYEEDLENGFFWSAGIRYRVGGQ